MTGGKKNIEGERRAKEGECEGERENYHQFARLPDDIFLLVILRIYWSFGPDKQMVKILTILNIR